MEKPHPYVFNNAFPGSWRPHAKFWPDWSSINLFSFKMTSCLCGYGKPIPLPCLYVCNNAYLCSWRAHTKLAFLSKCLAVMLRHIYIKIYIQTYTHTYKPKYILKWVIGSNSFALFRNFFLSLFHFAHQWGEV